MQLYTVFHTI